MTIQELESEYARAASEASTYLSRNLDPTTVQKSVDHARGLLKQLNDARNSSAMMTALERQTAGLTVGGGSIGGRSVGAQIVNGAIGQYLRDNKVRSGYWTTPVMNVDIMATTLSEGAASAGKLVIPDYRPEIIPLPLTLPTARTLLSDGTTTSNLSVYMKETAFTNAAAPVAEGAAKPESGLVFDQASDEVEVLAHWLPVTNQLLEDEPALVAYIDARLRLGLSVVEDAQILNGDGVSPNLHGLMARATAPDVARGTDTNADAIARQIFAIQTATNLPPTGIVINPANWLTILLAKDTNGQYYGAGPFATPQLPTLWGKVVAVTPAIAAGVALVVTREAAMVLQRTPANVAISNSHQDFFVRNQLAIRCEERITLDVFRAASFGKVTGLN